MKHLVKISSRNNSITWNRSRTICYLFPSIIHRVLSAIITIVRYENVCFDKKLYANPRSPIARITGPNNYSRKGRKRSKPETSERGNRPSFQFADRKNTAGRKREEKKGNGIGGRKLGRNSEISPRKHRITGLIGRFKRTGTTTCGCCACGNPRGSYLTKSSDSFKPIYRWHIDNKQSSLRRFYRVLLYDRRKNRVSAKRRSSKLSTIWTTLFCTLLHLVRNSNSLFDSRASKKR